MSVKDFKIKSGLVIGSLSSAGVITTDSSGNISSTSTIPLSSGGTGQTTANNALNALLPIQNGGTINYTIQSDGTNVSWAKLYNQLIKNDGVSVTPRRNLNFVGATLTDDSGSDTTTITFTDAVGVSKSGGDTITASESTVKGLIVKGAASQTANLQEWQNSAGTVLASIGETGKFYVASTVTTAPSAEFVINSSNPYPTFLVRTAAGAWINYVGASGTTMYNSTLIAANLATQIPLTVKGAASQTANLQEWQNSAGTILTKIRSSGALNVGGAFTSNTFGVANLDPVWVAVKVQGATSQTGNLQEWLNVAGTVLSKVDSNGIIYSPTAASGTNTTQVATTEFVSTAVNNLIDSAPGTLNTLNEIAAALNDDPNFSSTITTLNTALSSQDTYSLMGVF